MTEVIASRGNAADKGTSRLPEEEKLHRSCWKPGLALLCSGVACCLLLAAGACTSTSINGRKAENLTSGAFKKIAVLGFFNSLQDRKTFETLVVKALDEKGCDAVSSLDVLKHGGKHTKQELEEIFQREGFDAVLILRVSDVQQVRTDIPENYYFPLEPYVYSWYPYWTDGLGLMIRGGYHEKHDVVHMESGLFSMETEKLVWIGQSETKRVNSVKKLAGSLGPKIAKTLEKDGLIP